MLLDPPCSALGLRPRLLHAWGLRQLLQMADYQRALLHAAVALLKPGGTLVYSTCTISPGTWFESTGVWGQSWPGPACSITRYYKPLLRHSGDTAIAAAW